MYPFPNCGHNLTIPELQQHRYDQLRTERTYLLGVLQKENEKATDLLRKLRPLEDTLSLARSNHLHRAAKKELGWLRRRIKEGARQEENILTRLDQVSHEIQSQERRNQIHPDRSNGFQITSNHRHLGVFVQGEAGPARLNPLSRVFQPQRYSVPQPSWILQPAPQVNETNNYFGPLSNLPTASGLPTQLYDHAEKSPSEDISGKVEQVVEYETYQQPTVIHRSSSMNGAEFDMLATEVTFPSTPQLKRRSLPVVGDMRLNMRMGGK